MNIKYRFGSAIAEVHDFVCKMLVGEEKVFHFDRFVVNDLPSFRMSLSKIAVKSGWMCKTRVKEDGLWVKRIK